jgi:DNA-binding beta-propeller fold protein YncE
MRNLIFLTLLLSFISCNKEDNNLPLDYIVNEDISTYQEVSTLTLTGGAGAAEITTFDPQTNRLFAVNNGTTNKIDVIDFKNPASITVIHSISMSPYGGFVNSVDVKNGKLAAAIESLNKQESGKLVIFNTATFSEEKVLAVGALPDMVTFSPDGKYILTANEGEPDATYLNDPEGSVSITNVSNYSVRTINFASFEAQLSALAAKGFRIYGPGKNFTKDIEPESITVSEDSKTAWVALQENNAIAELDIIAGKITKIMPLGFKDYSLAGQTIDPSDKDSKVDFNGVYQNVFGMYLPDAISNFQSNGVRYLFTANEGDSREYTGFTEMKRVNTLALDPVKFPNGTALKSDAILGRLNVTTTLGDTDGDGDYDALYSLGGRSFSIWDAATGTQVYDSRNELDRKAVEIGVYDDSRSDDKSVEPEAVTIGRVGSKIVAFVGLERADAIAIYDVTNPVAPSFVKMVKTGDAPEGVLFIPASKSPIGQSLFIVSSENDGVLKVYKANRI